MTSRLRPGTPTWEKVRSSGGIGNYNTALERSNVKGKITKYELEHNISLDCREVYESLLKVLKKFSYLERCWSDAHDIEGITFYTGEHKHKVITVVLDDGDQFVFDEVIGYKSFTYIGYNNVQIQFDPVTYELIKDPDTERITPSDYTLFFTAAKVALDKIYELSHKTVTQEV